MRETAGLQLLPVPLLGRDRELAVIGELCERATGGRGGALLIEGPAGIGKTSVLHAARALADDAGLQRAVARGSEFEREFSYGIVRQLADPILRAQTPAGRAELLGGAAGLAAPALGLSSSETRGTGLSAERLESEQGAAFHGLYWLFANLAERGPLLMSVDDVHWADMLSLRFLAYLIRRIEDLPVVVLLAARSGEPGEGRAIVEQLSDEPDCATVRLGPIGDEEVAALVQAAFETQVEPGFSEAVRRVAGGNPFLVRELVRAARAEGVEPRQDQADRITRLGPDSVARSVRRRIERLGAEALAFAQAVAIIGTRARLGTAAALTELDLSAAARLAAELEASEILVADDDGLSFRHPILRAALYESIPQLERGLAHARAARVLTDGGSSEAAAAQLLRAPASGDRWVVEALREAARAAVEAGAPDTAAAYLERALAEPPDGGDRPPLMRELGLAEAAAGRPHATRLLREAIDGLPDPVARGATARDLARALAEELRFGEAAGVLVEAIEQLGERDRELWLLLESDLHDVARRDLGSRQFAERLARIVPTLSGETYAERVAIAQWHSSAMLGQARTASEAASLAERVASSVLELELELPGPGSLIHTLIAAERLELAESLIERILERARARGLTGILARALGLRAHLARARGSITDAETDGWLAVELRAANDAQPAAMIPAALVPVLIERGKVDNAQQLLEQAGLEGTLPDAMNFNLALFARARLRLDQGRIAEAIDDLHEVGARYAQWGIGRPIPPWRSLLARAHWANGDEHEAHSWAQRELTAASEWGTPRAVGAARLTLGLLAGGAAGLDQLQQAAATLADSPARLELAYALVELGAALRRANQRSAARDPLGRGMTLAAQCGADTLAERAREELRATGARPRRLMLSGLEALTPSERRVAELAAAGQTNKQIAQTLFVSTRTVETHVRHALQKLDITSREQLAGRLEAETGRSNVGGRG